MKRIAVVTPIPTPYRDPFWRAVQQAGELDLDVYYLAAGKPDRPWEVNWEMPRGAVIGKSVNLAAWRGEGASLYWNGKLTRQLGAEPYDAIVVGGYNHPALLATMWVAHRKGIPWYLMNETYRIGEGKRSAKSAVRRRLIRRVIRSSSGGFPTGRRARTFLLHFGAEPDSLCHLPNVPNIKAIADRVGQLKNKREDLRKAFGLEGRKLILFVGRLIPKKGVDLLIRAFSMIDCKVATLVIVGDGSERVRLERMVSESGIGDRVRFVGFCQPDEVLTWHAIADVFGLFSSETWGVAPIEAVAAGVPVVLSDAVGCSDDLRALNGALCDQVPHGDVPAFARALQRRLNGMERRESLHGTIRPSLESWTYEALVRVFCNAMMGVRRNL